MPTEPPATPRKMLPPPITMATCTPIFTTSATSSTILTMVARLMPKASSPIRASPDSFSKIRLWAGWATDMKGSLNNGLSVPTLRCSRARRRGLARVRKAGGPFNPSGAGLGGRHLSGHFGREVVHLLLDALAHHVKGKALHLGVGCLEHLLDGLLVVLHEGLVEQ